MLFLESPEPAVRLIVPPGDACLFDIAAQAASDHMHLVHNKGSQVVVCSIVPAGWSKLVVKEKPKKDGAIVHSSAYEPVSGGISALPNSITTRKIGTP